MYQTYLLLTLLTGTEQVVPYLPSYPLDSPTRTGTERQCVQLVRTDHQFVGTWQPYDCAEPGDKKTSYVCEHSECLMVVKKTSVLLAGMRAYIFKHCACANLAVTCLVYQL